MRLQTLQSVARSAVNLLTLSKEKLFSPRLLLYTNTGICVGMSVAGDALQQLYQASHKEKLAVWDRKRTSRIAVSGCLMGPIVHYWYIFLDGWLPGRTLRVLCKKVLLDQLICSPLFLSVFIFSMSYMENRTWPEVKEQFMDKGKVLYVAEWVVWPPAQFINFMFLPTKYRVLFDGTVSLAFDCFWSYVWFEMDGKVLAVEDAESSPAV